MKALESEAHAKLCSLPRGVPLESTLAMAKRFVEHGACLQPGFVAAGASAIRAAF